MVIQHAHLHLLVFGDADKIADQLRRDRLAAPDQRQQSASRGLVQINRATPPHEPLSPTMLSMSGGACDTDLVGRLAGFRFLLCGRDAKFTSASGEILASQGARIARTPSRTSRANSHAERRERTVRAAVPLLCRG